MPSNSEITRVTKKEPVTRIQTWMSKIISKIDSRYANRRLLNIFACAKFYRSRNSFDPSSIFNDLEDRDASQALSLYLYGVARRILRCWGLASVETRLKIANKILLNIEKLSSLIIKMVIECLMRWTLLCLQTSVLAHQKPLDQSKLRVGSIQLILSCKYLNDNQWIMFKNLIFRLTPYSFKQTTFRKKHER